MKRIIIFSAILLFLVGFFFACEGTEKEDNTRKAYSIIEEGRFVISETEFVTMRLLSDNGFIDSPVKLILENHSKGKLIYDYSDFSWEYFDKENWTKIESDDLYLDIAFILKPGETQEREIYFSDEYFNRPGKYRIVFQSGIIYDSQDSDPQDINLQVEFEIKSK